MGMAVAEVAQVAMTYLARRPLSSGAATASINHGRRPLLQEHTHLVLPFFVLQLFFHVSVQVRVL